MVYKDCIIKGPYLRKKDNRLIVIATYNNGYKTTISYPKYLMEVHLGRYLEDEETIDHIDNNPLNNDITNLRVLKRNIHTYEDALRNKDILVRCTFCGKEFSIKGDKVHCRNRKDRYQSGYFCSRQCSGKYGKNIQLGLIKPITVDKVIPNKYKAKSAKDENL